MLWMGVFHIAVTSLGAIGKRFKDADLSDAC